MDDRIKQHVDAIRRQDEEQSAAFERLGLGKYEKTSEDCIEIIAWQRWGKALTAEELENHLWCVVSLFQRNSHVAASLTEAIRRLNPKKRNRG